jgi:tripartite-type tricarboxylate transporter receptor subunit TctC
LSFGSGGTGTLFHLAAEYFKSMTKTNMFHVPYKGSVPALQDVMGGHIDFLFDNIGSNVTHVLAGTVKGLGVTSPQRAVSLPDVPTFAELGFPDFDVSQWYGLFAPPGTPPEIIGKLQGEVAKALASPDVAARLYTLGNEAVGSSASEFRKILVDEHARWSLVIRESGLDLQ